MRRLLSVYLFCLALTLFTSVPCHGAENESKLNEDTILPQMETTRKSGGRITKNQNEKIDKKTAQTVPANPVLPPLHPPPEKEETIVNQPSFIIRKFNFDGNTVFSDAQLTEVVFPYKNHSITSEELQEVRHKLTLHYVNAGYINSGAIIPDQKVTDGEILIQITEGKLTEIEISGNTHFRSAFIRKRLEPDAGAPFNVTAMQERIQLLLQHPLIQKINAEISPGMIPGQAVLKAQVEERTPWLLDFEFSNNRSPAVGPLRFGTHLAYRNLLGWGDAVGGTWGISENRLVADGSIYYTLPLTSRDTLLNLHYSKNTSMVVEAPFDMLNINSEIFSYGFDLTHPFIKSPSSELSLGIGGERRTSKTYLLDRPFQFSPGATDGESRETVLHFSGRALSRSINRVIAFQANVNVGIDAFGVTRNNASEPDGLFISYLLQFQWAERFARLLDSQLITKINSQITRNPLLTMEKFAIGGVSTVRGYRESQFVADNAVTASLEWRVPILNLRIPKISSGPEDGVVQLTPFFDWGWGKNVIGESISALPIYSAGCGLLWSPSKQISAQIYWGYAFRDVPNQHKDIQDSGIHFMLKASIF